MILTTPFHERTAALNQTGLWSHWSHHLAADRYQLSDKAEYFAVRNSAGVFDTSPLFKYRISGRDAERFLAGVLLRDVRACEVGHGQYTCWLDSDGYVVEDGVVLHLAPDEYLLTSAEPNFAWFADQVLTVHEPVKHYVLVGQHGFAPGSIEVVANFPDDGTASADPKAPSASDARV